MGKFNKSVSSFKSFAGESIRMLMPGSKEDSLKAHLTRGAAGTFILKAVSTGLMLLLSIVLARVLGAREFGYYSYALAIINLLVIPTTLGLPTLVIRHTAAYKAKGLWSHMRGLIVRANQAVLLVSLVLGGLSFIAAYYFGDYIPSLSLPVFYAALLLMPILGLNAIREAALKGLNHVVLGQLPEHILRHALFLVLILLLILLFDPGELDSTLAMWLQLLATLIAFGIGIFLLFKKLPQQVREAASEYDTRNWLKSAAPLLVVGALQVVNRRTDIIMLGAFSTSEAVGIYQVVTRGAELIIFSLFAVNMAVAPIISRLYVNGEMKKLQQITTASTFAIIAFSAPVALVLIFFGSWILEFVFGAEFALGAAALAILSVGHLINSVFGSVGYLLNMTGHEKDSAKAVGIAASMNIILNLILIPLYGMEGAAAATFTSLTVWNILLSVFVYKRLKIYPSIFGLLAKK